MGAGRNSLEMHLRITATASLSVSKKWRDLRGIEIVSFGVSSVTADAEDEKMLKELQRNAAFMDPTRAAAHLAGSQGDAMKAAAANKGGAAMAFMGMNMAGQAGGMNAHDSQGNLNVDIATNYCYVDKYQTEQTNYNSGYSNYKFQIGRAHV